jgi:hypothetical protein
MHEPGGTYFPSRGHGGDNASNDRTLGSNRGQPAGRWPVIGASSVLGPAVWPANPQLQLSCNWKFKGASAA